MFSAFSFGGFPILFTLVFILVFGLIVLRLVQGAARWNRNNNSPVLTVVSKVVAKRSDVSHHTHHHGDNMHMHHSSSSTAYYATFEFESGDRLELRIPSGEYGYVIEGDMGRLTFQGTRYLGFQRMSDGDPPVVK